MNSEQVNRFFAWINERHAIYLRKKEGRPWPWTKDPILQTYKFTNVFRELDTETILLRENWREPYADHPHLWFAIAAYRAIGLYSTMRVLGFPNNPVRWLPRVSQTLQRWSIERRRVFTGAYIICFGVVPPGKSYIADVLLKGLWDARRTLEPRLREGSIQGAFDALREHRGWGPFMAYEVVTDLRHTRYLNKATDIMTWANIGPGSRRGINRILRQPVKATLSTTTGLSVMQELLARSDAETHSYVPALEIRDIEHSLCEFDKYERARTGMGRPRALYRGGKK